MLEIAGLRKSFADGDRRVDVLSGLELKLAAGEFVALLGRSGSGKSTLLNCIAGLEPVDAGTISIDGHEMSGLGELERTLLRRRRIGIIFQFFELLPTLSVEENVALPLLLAGSSRAQARARAQHLLAELQLADRAAETPEHLSGGERQRVATARALVHEPALILADEPTGNLDSAAAERTLALLAQLRQQFGVSIVMATHSREAAAAADRRLQLVEGLLVPWQEPVAAPAPVPQRHEPAPAPKAPPVEDGLGVDIDAILEENSEQLRPRDAQPHKLSAEEIAAMRLQARRDEASLTGKDSGDAEHDS